MSQQLGKPRTDALALTFLAGDFAGGGFGDDPLDRLLHTIRGGFGFRDFSDGLLSGLLGDVELPRKFLQTRQRQLWVIAGVRQTLSV